MLNQTILTNKKGFLFDMDGTLIDSMWMWEAIDIEFLSRYQIPYDQQLQREIEGKSFTECAAYFRDVLRIPETPEIMMAEWNQMAKDKYEHEVTLKEGVSEFLEYAKENHIPMAIATSNSRFLASKVLKKLGVEGYFQSIITSDEVAHGKPSPDIYLASAAALGVRPCDCLVFEDVFQGVMAGKSAGIEVCAVYDSCNPQWEETRNLADYHIQSFTELTKESFTCN